MSPPIPDAGPPRGEGEDAMQGLIRHQVVNILQPIADNVRELQAQLGHMRKDIALTDAGVSKNRASLDQHDRELLAVRTGAGQMNARIDKTQLELHKDREESAIFRTDLDNFQIAIQRMDERQQHAKSLAEVLEQKVADLGSTTLMLQHNSDKMDGNIRETARSLAQLHGSHEHLNNRHLQHANKLEETGFLRDRIERDFEIFLREHKQQSEEDTQLLQNLNVHMNKFSAMLDETRTALHKQECNMKTVQTEVEVLRIDLVAESGAIKKLDQLERRQTGTAEALKRTIDSASATEQSLEQLGDSFVANKVSVAANIEDLITKTEDNAECIAALLKAQQNQGDVLKDTLWKTDKSQRGLQRLQEQAAGTENEVHGLLQWHKTAKEKIDSQTAEHQKTKAEVHALGKDMDHNMHAVKGDLGSASDTLAQLANRFEDCHKNIQGVHRGLSDVNRHVVLGEHGMLTPKPNRSVALPTLSSRTPRPTKSSIFSGNAELIIPAR